MDRTLALIGGGNMGRAIIGGLLNKDFDPARIEVVEPDPARRAALAETLGVAVAASAAELESAADIVLLAVKPQIMAAVAAEIRPQLDPAAMPLVMSIAAGITTAQLRRWIAPNCRVVRVMPNTPALVGAGAAALFATANVTSAERAAADAIMSAVGLSVWLDDEAQIDAVTALSGSGPAYFFLVLEALEAAGSELGLPADLARRLAIQTAYGSALLAQQSADDPAELRRQVTSPGGTTERAVDALLEADIFSTFSRALSAAHQRARELAKLSEEESN